MNRDVVGPVALAIVCVLAVAFASATLTSTTKPTGEGVGSGGGNGAGGERAKGVDMGGNASEGLADLGSKGPAKAPFCFEYDSPLLTMLTLCGLFGIGYLVRRRTNTILALGVLAAIGGPLGMLYSMLSRCQTGTSPPQMLSKASAGGGGASASGSPESTNPAAQVDFPMAIFFLLGVGVVLMVAMAVSQREDYGDSLPDLLPSGESTVEPDFSVDAGAVGRAAGRAADRIEAGTGVENEVYRAWVEMTHHLDVRHPQSSTPTEFAKAAAEAGLDREDVDELTDLFREVRYGGREASEDRERRAVEALRRIEDQYADEGGGGDDLPE